MPLYEYRCLKCGHEFEELVSFADADKVACEQCGSKKTERLVSVFCDAGGDGEGEHPGCFSGG